MNLIPIRERTNLGIYMITLFKSNNPHSFGKKNTTFRYFIKLK